MHFLSYKLYFYRSLRPVVVEFFEQNDDQDGYPDKNVPRKTPEFFKSREVGPRFAQVGSFEHEYGTRWKQLHELYKQKEEALKREMAMEEEKLEAQMEYARYEHETELLRERKSRMQQQNGAQCYNSRNGYYPPMGPRFPQFRHPHKPPPHNPHMPFQSRFRPRF